MTIDVKNDPDLLEIQKAQNTLGEFYSVLMESLKEVELELPLYFYSWESTDHYYKSSEVHLGATPIWQGGCSAFSHIPLLYSYHHFSTLEKDVLVDNNSAAIGEALVTFRIAPNVSIMSAYNQASVDDSWPVTLPIERPYADVVVYKVTAPSKKSLLTMWSQVSWPVLVESKGCVFQTEDSNLLGWCESFSLAQFLLNRRTVFADIKAYLGI
jgi:hypothetical protein